VAGEDGQPGGVMRGLLIYPVFPQTFWSFDRALRLIGRKALLPPLGLVTVAALLPRDWELKLVDCNVRPVTDAEWAWADIVLLSGMIAQKSSLLALVGEAKRRGTPVVVGGPYVTSVPEDADAAGADYVVMDEGEITVPPFLDHLRAHGLARREPGAPPVVFRANGEKPDLTATPIPRFDLLDLFSYDSMAVQHSRGCPFLCEFCDIITLYGRRPRTKAPGQFLAEIDRLYDLGWRRSIFIVDDNFIGNKPNVRKLLPVLRGWQEAHGYPFSFDTEASIDLAADASLLQLMVDSGFSSVFIGVETPDEDSLESTRKHQNTRAPMIESLQTITRAGLRVMMGMIIGFDNEAKGAGERIVRFTETAGVPHTMVSMLQALPNTGLWTRLEAEGRLRAIADVNQTTLLNFVPTRPISEIAHEYLDAYDRLYDPRGYLDRTYRYYLELGRREHSHVPADPKYAAPPTWEALRRRTRDLLYGLRALAIVCWRQGVQRESRWMFWHHLASMLRRKPIGLVFEQYLVVCAHNEHFLQYRRVIRDRVEAQLRAEPHAIVAAAVRPPSRPTQAMAAQS
jgi:radical SAM superfamily enzyme YgiQ (UPF0313 family)